MALIKCKECEREISSKSRKCIHCGAKVNEKNKIFNQLIKIVKNKLFIILLILCILIVSLCFLYKSNNTFAFRNIEIGMSSQEVINLEKSLNPNVSLSRSMNDTIFVENAKYNDYEFSTIMYGFENDKLHIILMQIENNDKLFNLILNDMKKIYGDAIKSNDKYISWKKGKIDILLMLGENLMISITEGDEK